MYRQLDGDGRLVGRSVFVCAILLCLAASQTNAHNDYIKFNVIIIAAICDKCLELIWVGMEDGARETDVYGHIVRTT